MPYEIPRKLVDIVLRINHYKFADLQFADWYASEICGFAIAGLAQEFADLQSNIRMCLPAFAHYGSIILTNVSWLIIIFLYKFSQLLQQ